jgi:hypothetical protein
MIPNIVPMREDAMAEMPSVFGGDLKTSVPSCSFCRFVRTRNNIDESKLMINIIVLMAKNIVNPYGFLRRV